MTTLLYLICGHYLGDFGLQNDFVANMKKPGLAPFWMHVMSGHCAIHAGIVLLSTGMWQLCVAEFTAHFIIDSMKCTGKFTTNAELSFHIDQFLHLLCKFVWFGVFVFYG